MDIIKVLEEQLKFKKKILKASKYDAFFYSFHSLNLKLNLLY